MRESFLSLDQTKKQFNGGEKEKKEKIKKRKRKEERKEMRGKKKRE